MTLTEALDALVVEHDRIGSPLRSRLGPGVPRVKVETALQPLGLTTPDELFELFGWHEILDEPDDRSRVEWFWSGAPYRLDEAVRVYRQSMDSGGVTAAEFDDLVRTHDPRDSFTGFWREDWFPILYGTPEEYAIECEPAAGHPAGGSAAGSGVWRASWHPDNGFPNMRLAPTVTAFVERVVELFRLDAYVWNTDYGSLETIDAIFEREGLGYDARPWPSLPG